MTTETITLYSKPACQGCRLTAQALDKAGLPYTKVDITQDPEAEAYVRSLGYLQMPVVVAGEEHWGDFRPDRVKALSGK